MRKLKLFFACLLMTVLSIGQVWADKVTAVANIESGKKYYIGATKSDNSDWYLSVADNGNVTGKKQGTAVSASDPTNAAVFTFTSTSGGWTIQFESGKYLTLPTTKDNGKVYVQDDAANWTITNVSGKALMNFKIGSFCLQRNSSSSLNFGSYASGQLDLWLEPVSSGDPDACATPTFSPAAGAVLSGTTVSISCATDGATIHYTTNGNTPTTSSPAYSTPIAINSNTTIKAIAVKSGMTNSAEATAAYTIATPYTTIEGLYNAKTAADQSVYVSFGDWKVSAIKGGQAYLTDGTNGLIIYQSGHGFAIGNTLSGTVPCTLVAFNGAAELKNVTNTTTGLTVTSGTIDPVVKTVAEANALTSLNIGSLIKLEGVTYNGSALVDEYSNTIIPSNNLFSGLSLENGKKYDVTGVFQIYNSVNQIYPRSATDVVEVVEEGAPEAPTFSPATGTYTSVQSVEISCATEDAAIYYTTDGTTPTSESNAYTAAISVGENMTIKAIAIKNAKESTVATAVYTINLPEDEEVQKTWDLSIDETETASEDELTWTATYVDMSFAKGTSSTNANNYYPGTSGQSYTSTRTYKNSVITITPASSKQITTVVFTATTSGYATTLKNALWTNATAVASDVTVTVTASGSGAISAVLGGTAGFSSVVVHYEPYVAPATYAVAFATPDHGTLTISNGDDPIASGDEFEEGTELTVSTEPASGYILDAIKVIETGSDPENDVTSTVLSGSTLTVPAFAITVSATFKVNVKPSATLTLSENGVPAPMEGEYHQDDVVNLPLTSSADCVKEFVGWSANASCAEAPEYAPGAEYTLTSTEQTLYAVYATASGTSYVKTALANIASGSEVVITELYSEDIYAAANDGGTSSGPAEIVLTETENVLNVGDNTNIFWIISKDGDNFSFSVKGGTDKLYCTNTNNGVRVGTNENNVFSIKSNYLYNNATLRYVGYNHQDGGLFRCYTSINSNINNETLAFYKKTATYSDYATTCVAALANPVFTPTAGVYSEAKNIVITAEEGTIYYTLDGTDPTNASTEYNAPIVLDANGTTTIKAIAISATSQSAIVSATYTINLPLSTMDAIYAAAEAAGTTATDANIQFKNWVVSGVSTNGKNVFVTDGTKGFIIFDNGGEMGFAVGDVLSGTVACKVQLYKGAAELTTLSSTTEGLSIAKEGVVTPVAKAITALSGINTGAPVTINGVQFDGTNLTDGTNSIKPYNSLFAYDALENGKYYNVTGIYQQFDDTKEILPRSAADIEEVNLADPEISYSPATLTITDGDAWSAPTLVNPHTLAIASYASDNESVATVTDGGLIALAGGHGTAVITAHTNGNSTYGAGNATYTITVNAPAPAPTGTTYHKVTATEDLTDGEYLIVYEDGNVAFDGALTTLDAVGNTVAVTINEGVIAGTAAIDAAVFTIDVTAGSIKSASNKYIGVSSYSNGLSVSDDADAFENALSIDADGNAVIVITTTGGDMTLRYNSASNQLRFRYYKSGQQAIQLYKKDVVTPVDPTPDYTRDVASGNYGTICLPKAGTISGATLFEIAYKGGGLIYVDEILNGEMEAGVPYIFYATSDQLSVVYDDNTVAPVAATDANGLHGFYDLDHMATDEAAQKNLTQDDGNYILYDNQYWLVSGRDAFIYNFRAYIKLGEISTNAPEPQQGAPRRRVAMTVNGEQTATGIGELNASETPVKMIIDGQLFIIRGEKMYNANGQLVK